MSPNLPTPSHLAGSGTSIFKAYLLTGVGFKLHAQLAPTNPAAAGVVAVLTALSCVYLLVTILTAILR